VTVPHPTGFSRDTVEACVGRISVSPHFRRSTRLRSFLRFTVEAMLEGRAGELKERTLGTEVYHRDADYDPRKDPIVRSEAHRLRARLDAYYEQEGRFDPVVIRYPRGSYAPEIRPNKTQAHDHRAAARASEAFLKGRHNAIEYGNSHDLRQLEWARRRLRVAVEEDPKHVDALAELANVELLRLYPPRGETAQLLASARQYLERALAMDPRHARSLYLLGHVLGTALETREALRLTESAVAIDPEDPEGRTMLAVRYASMGFWEAAIASCDLALDLDPVWEAPHRTKIYLLTRMGRFADAREAIAVLTRASTGPTELAIARFDLRLAQGDLEGARSALESQESTFPVRPDLKDRQELASALADALQGDCRSARLKLDAHRDDAPRFWDHTIRLALALGDAALARQLFCANAINGTYRWLANEPLVRPHLHRPAWRALAEERHARWLQDLEEVGPRLPAAPPALPEPDDLVASPAG
jgi:tetratricopeptide (TPR) repeat protein